MNKLTNFLYNLLFQSKKKFSGCYVNPNSKDYSDTIRTETFVDKSLFIADLSEYIDTENKYLCVSRPRRFGKSVNAQMLTAFFSKGADSAYMFDNLKIAQWDGYKEHLNKHNVISLKIQNLLNNCNDDVFELIKYINHRISKEIKKTFNNVDFSDCNTLYDCLQEVYSQSDDTKDGTFIFIIDEWDTVFRYNKITKEGQEAYIQFLNGLLKDQSYVSLVFMTGILPVKKYSTDSLLNMFTECSVVSNTFADYFGFTDEEVKALCQKFNKDYSKFKAWYDGYTYSDKHHIFNANSVCKAILENRMDSFWSLTEKYERINDFIDLNIDGLREDVIRLLSGEHIQVIMEDFGNQLYDLSDKNNILAALVHLGYLTIHKVVNPDEDDEITYYASIPNKEIRKQFVNNLAKSNHYKTIYEAIQQSKKLLEGIWNKDTQLVSEYIDNCHSDNTSIIKYNDENSLSAVISIALYAAQSYYHCVREMPCGKGYADLVYIPLPKVNKPALVVELKYNDSTTSALTQIKDKHYPDSIAKFSGEVLLVAINYDKKTKTHTTMIESFTK